MKKATWNSNRLLRFPKANLNVYSCCPAWSLPPGCGPGGEHGRRRTLPLFAPLQHREQEAGSMVSVTDARLRATIQPSMCGQCGMSMPVLGECGYALRIWGECCGVSGTDRYQRCRDTQPSTALPGVPYVLSCWRGTGRRPRPRLSVSPSSRYCKKRCVHV